jgi:phage terminase large subunit
VSAIRIINDKGEWEDFYVPTPKQQEFHSRTEANVLFWGGRGSGKSAALRNEAHARALAYPGFKYIILRRTYPELQNSHLSFVPAEMKKLGGRFHYTEHAAIYPNGSRGVFSHCANEEDVLKLLSSEFYWMGVDELSTFEWDMFTRLAASVRVPAGSGLTAMVRAATNPLGPSAADLMTYFVTKDVDIEQDPDYNPDDWYSIHANLVDNPHLDQEQYMKRFSGLPQHVRKAWVDGEFILENSLFDFYPTKNGRPYHVIREMDVDKLAKVARIYRVYDHGWAPDPAYCAWIAHLGNRYIVFHEQIWIKTIVADIAADIHRIDEMLGVERVVTTYCDPTIDIHTGHEIRTIKSIFEDNGIGMECSINNREQFASAVHTALGEEVEPGVPRIQIYVGPKGRGCPYLAKSIPLQRYNPPRPLAMDDQKDDHPVVSIAYFLISNSSLEQRSIETRRPRRWMQNPVHKEYLGNDNVRRRY